MRVALPLAVGLLVHIGFYLWTIDDPSPAPARLLSATIDGVEEYQWKFDKRQGFKVFVTVNGTLPPERLKIVIFSSFRGWDIIRADEEPQPDEPELSSNQDAFEYIVRWHDRPKPDHFKASFWFHREPFWDEEEIDWDRQLEVVRKNIRIELSGK